MTNVREMLTQIAELTIRARVGFALSLCELCLDSISPDRNASRVAADALAECWAWLKGEPVTADSLAERIDGPADKELSIHLLNHEEGPVLYGLIAITEGVSYVAYQAYEKEGNRMRSAPIWEVSEETLASVLSQTEKVRADLNVVLPEIISRLVELSVRQSNKELGSELRREQIFQHSRRFQPHS
jgi:hypothetical protein